MMSGRKRVVHPLARTFVVVSGEKQPYSFGTGFSLGRGELVLTAAHVVGTDTTISIATFGAPGKVMVEVKEAIRHPHADIAALRVASGAWEEAGWNEAEWWDLGVRNGGRPFSHGTEVGAWGWPVVGDPGKTPPRYMKGHIQAIIEVQDAEYRYAAYELGFPAFGGLSGAPVFFDDMYVPYQENYVIGMVTESVQPVDEDNKITDLRWTHALDLGGVQPWLAEIDPRFRKGGEWAQTTR